MGDKRNALLLGICLMIGAAPTIASGFTPMEQMQATMQQVIAIVSDAAGAGPEQRQARLRETLMPRFDWATMAKHSLGEHWDKFPDRHDEFTTVFAEFLGSAYIGKIGSVKDERIVFVQETVQADRAQVESRIIPNKGDPVDVSYRLHPVNGEWKVYDVVVADISLVGNFRSQFRRLLAKGSFDDLLKQLREKDKKSHD